MILMLLLAAIGCFAQPLQVKEQTLKEGIFCRTCGKGAPLIVIHGGPGMTQDYLQPQLYRLCEDNFVIFYDQGERTTLEALINDIETIRTNFHYGKVSLLGHSWGGYVAMQYAIAHPDRVEKMILANSEPATHEGYCAFGAEWVRRTEPIKERLDALQTEDPRWSRLMFSTYTYRPSDADKLTLGHFSMKTCTDFTENYLMKPYDLCAALKRLRIPTLIIHGKNDIIPVTSAHTIHGCLANSELVLIEECGHFPYVEQPDAFFNKIRAFLCDDTPDCSFR